MAEVAAVGWAISTVGWIASPVTTRVLNKGFDLLGFDESDKMRDLEDRILPRMEMLLQQADSIPPHRRARLDQWISRLRSAFYDAEDIVDLADYHRLKKQVISRSGTKSMLGHAKHVISGKNGKLKKVITKLEKLIEEGSQLLPPLASNDSCDISNPAAKVNATTSSAPTQGVIGRDKERDNIIKLLREASGDAEPSSRNRKCFSVIGIYGIPGSGKTTLAQHVYYYERMKKYFYPVMWIHVSKGFSVHKVYQKMLEEASGEPSREFSNLNALQMKLEAELTGKRFLLVLDDIWYEKDVSVQDELEQLLSPLKVGERRSKVLVTTRFKDAALSLGAQSPMQIPDLKEKDFVHLFMHYALDGANLEPQESQILRTIGGQIVKKLKRSPLAARVVGARLRKQLKAVFWERVADQDVLTETMGALWWSYRHLDEQVRRCFAYCSMFPQGYMFERDALVDLWLAEGFIKQTNSVGQMEDLGEKYFDELVSCSFLQATKYSGDSDNEWFTIHDLLHELAIKVAGNDCFRVEGGEMKQFPPDVRHLFVRSDDPMKVTEEICKLKKLRTLFITTNFDGQGITIEALEVMLKKLKKLRVVQVYLKEYTVTIPDCICDLKHLRWLSIGYSHSVDDLKVHFPRSLDTLYHLHTLRFGDSDSLEFSNVKNMSNLINLRKIKNRKVGFLSSYDCNALGFPGVGKLKSLRELPDFSVRKKKGYELQQLKSQNHLGGSLRISGLENVESKESALEAKLTDKKDLAELSLAWSSRGQQNCSPDLQVEIIEGLCPPSQLTELGIYGYSGWKCPSWLTQNQNGNALIRSLKCLKLEECCNLEALPDNIDHFVHLRELRLVDLPKLQKLPRLPDSLKTLDIQICKSLVLTYVEDVEVIRSLFIESASQIEPSLSFTVHLPEEIDRFASEQPKRFEAILSSRFGSEGTVLARLIRGQIIEEDYSSQFQLPASLDRLIISYCAITDTILQNCLRSSTSLTSLVIIGLPFFRAIPTEVMKCLAKLRHLSICDCECVHFTRLQGLNHLSTLETLDVRGCAKLTALQEAEKVRTLRWLAVDDIPLVPNLLSREAISSLRILRIDGSEEPTEEEILQQLSSLTYLDLFQCNWNSLPENLASLTCLQELSLYYCKHIRSLPTLPASLRSFELRDCDQTFMKSCQKDGDPNWQKIAHVPNKRFS